jgi:hypothetical protein
VQEVVGSSQEYAPIKRLLDTLIFMPPMELKDQLELGKDLGDVGIHPKRVSFVFGNHSL